jgi:hypothetical protein
VTRRRPRLVPPSKPDRAAELDTRGSLALQLLREFTPLTPPVADVAFLVLGEGRHQELQADPRYLIGRLQQALTALLDAHPYLPPMDAQTELLADALGDAIEYRRYRISDGCAECIALDEICAAHNEDWIRSERYEALLIALGCTADDPLPRPELTVVKETDL